MAQITPPVGLNMAQAECYVNNLGLNVTLGLNLPFTKYYHVKGDADIFLIDITQIAIESDKVKISFFYND